MLRGSCLVLSTVKPPSLTERDADVLWQLSEDNWVPAFFVGGSNGSHHSGTLRKLVRHGLVERNRRGGWTRPSYVYRLTQAGADAHRAYRDEHGFSE